MQHIRKVPKGMVWMLITIFQTSSVDAFDSHFNSIHKQRKQLAVFKKTGETGQSMIFTITHRASTMPSKIITHGMASISREPNHFSMLEVNMHQHAWECSIQNAGTVLANCRWMQANKTPGLDRGKQKEVSRQEKNTCYYWFQWCLLQCKNVASWMQTWRLGKHV